MCATANCNLVRALQRGAKNAGKTVATRGLRLAMFRSPSQLAARFWKAWLVPRWITAKYNYIASVQSKEKTCNDVLNVLFLELCLNAGGAMVLLRSQILGLQRRLQSNCALALMPKGTPQIEAFKWYGLNWIDMIGRAIRATPSPSAFPWVPSWQKGGRA